MGEIEKAGELIEKNSLENAQEILDSLLVNNPDNDRALYLRALIHQKRKSYNLAIENFTKAISIKRKKEYLRELALCNFELFDLDESMKNLRGALEIDDKDFIANFFYSMCLVLMDDPRAKKALENTKKLDEKKTKLLLKSFANLFIDRDPRLSSEYKRNLHSKIENF